MGASGFFCVDQPWIPEPYFVKDRAQALASDSASPFGISLRLEQGPLPELDELSGQKPKLEFVRDRWPLFTSETEAVTSTELYFVHDGTVFDVWTCTWKKSPIPALGGLIFDTDLLIRELDFVNPGHAFNEASERSETYSASLGLEGNCLILCHAKSESEGVETDVGLIVTFFVNGTVQRLEEVDGRPQKPDFRMNVDEDIRRSSSSQSLELVTAYRLQKLSGEFNKASSPISPSSYFSLSESLTASPYTKLTYSPDFHLDFIIRRNLEHILSVCSIPIPEKGSGDVVGHTANKPHDMASTFKVAMTCGDISGHRLVNPASFFAFQFLLSVYEYLNALSRGSMEHQNVHLYCQNLLGRIRSTCEAHLNWVFGQATIVDGCFAANYWASGHRISFSGSRENLSVISLSDTPFQIIKLADFARTMDGSVGNNSMRGYARKVLEERIYPWTRTLDNADKRSKCAFPRPGTQKYRLEDHVWIWRAMRSIEDLGLGSCLDSRGGNQFRSGKAKAPKKGVSNLEDINLEEAPARDFSSAEVQRRVLKRFTTENIASRRRMISVSRTSAETRFLLHSRDTCLFYESSAPFFNKAESLWRATIEAQKYHEANEDSSWDNPLRYAIALIMASRGLQINWKPPEDMFLDAKRILLGSSSPNGLFPGQINNATKEPEMFHDAGWRDFYWHVGFEVPFILWKYCNAVVTKVESPRASSVRGLPAKQASGDDTFLKLHPPALGLVIADDPALNTEIKKRLPLNTFIDQTSIVELPDEWLYNYPEFLDFDPKEQYEGFFGAINQRDIEAGARITEAMHVFSNRQKENGTPLFSDEFLKGIVVDVPRTTQAKSRKTGAKPSQVPEENAEPSSTTSIYEKLSGLRTSKYAKKRLIWIPNGDLDTLLVCFLAAPDTEKIYLSSFFDRHKNREKFFLDDATAALNTWRTEFHLSSYRLLGEGDSPNYKGLSFLGGNQKIQRSALGFLFTGDFFDRYWTCYVLEYDPVEHFQQKKRFQGTPENYARLSESFKNLIIPKKILPRTDLERRPWRQRKVLELLLFDRMLQGISRQYEEISLHISDQLIRMLGSNDTRSLLASAMETSSTKQSVVALSSLLFSAPMDNGNYLKFSKDWPQFQYNLQVMEDDLKENLDKIALWLVREQDREPERPRWTRNDERKYRSAISKLSFSNNQRLRELQHHLANIQSLRASLASRLESTRNDLSFQSAENVRYFTFVTVVFLPLGFSTALFSMNDPPRGESLRWMVVTAVVALCLTVLALANAQYWGQISNPIQMVSRSLLYPFRLASHTVTATLSRSMGRKAADGSIEDAKNGESSASSGEPYAEDRKPSSPNSSLHLLIEKCKGVRKRTGRSPDDVGLEAGRPVSPS
ncbi:Mg2+ transporter protein CorA-like/Zinc transport protein ZntB [Macrophomina phaseolina MS6]|uniref:Mg2+ transporter protein CorA-like/Zinc transport protein ZntB n=1 Tax=Macrophomina phaseolina (strain MS6) TaxID=1126212 RepID=K2SC09_MACPH|nr:Mg2+ transporter protein CorA-like/Zinc transport protein ZntB [Macrophomina phaseolina MS6]